MPMTWQPDALQITSAAERPELLDQMEPIIIAAFPTFLAHDHVWNECWPALLDAWPELHLFLVDSTTDAALAMISAIPLEWDGTPEGLPAGTHAAMLQAVDSRGGTTKPNTACGIQAVVDQRHLGKGLGPATMRAFFANARTLGYEHLISPIRPTAKQDYPTVPLERYVHWTRSDGLPFDPWLRLMHRTDGTMLHVCNDSLVMEGSPDEWQEWTGLWLPESGDYVIPGGHVLLTIDRENNYGRYSEPHVWYRFP